MKTFLLSLVLCFVLVLNSSAQVSPEKIQTSKNFLYGSPFGVFANTFEMGIEHDLKSMNSIMVIGGFTMMKGNTQERQGGSGELHYRINMVKHPSKDIKKGLQSFTFFAPYGRFEYLDITDNSYSSTSYGSYYGGTPSKSSIIRAFSGGFLMGWRASSTEHRFSFAVYAGGGMKVADVLGNKKYGDVFRSGYTGVIPKAGCQFGISF